MTPQRRAVFLDRDGVINETLVKKGVPHPPDAEHQTRILPRVPEALALLKQLGLMTIVVTNQPDIARGTQKASEVDAINRYLGERLPLDEFRVCPHDGPDGCDCRKPKPGLILAAARAHAIDLAASFMVGDRAGDILAGAAAGCQTFLVARPYSKMEECRPDHVVADLAEAATLIARLVKQPEQNR
jgi:D-glycero-D-manno-heptose 1,7-bisphosphate phosphatase